MVFWSNRNLYLSTRAPDRLRMTCQTLFGGRGTLELLHTYSDASRVALMRRISSRRQGESQSLNSRSSDRDSLISLEGEGERPRVLNLFSLNCLGLGSNPTTVFRRCFQL